MLKQLIVILFFLVLTGAAIPTFGTNHYVDKNASGSNNGTSWANAWKNFASINWGSINPGDYIYISGGTDYTTYSETLTIGKSGTSSARIIISKGTDTGHNGRVVIDGANSRSNGVFVNGKSYITVTGLEIKRTTEGSVEVRYSHYIRVQYCKATVTGRAGVYLWQNTYTEVKNCDISTGTYVNTQTDGIYSQFNTNNTYYKNHIVVNNSEPTGHYDCIQSYKDKNLTIHSNYIEQNNSKTSNAQGIFATTPTGGVFNFYNNVLNMTLACSNGITFRRLTGTGTVQMIGNTVYGLHSSSLLQTTETPNPIIKNNVIYSGSSACGARILNWSGTSTNIDNNIIYVPNSSYVWIINNNIKTWSQWRAMGFDLHGKNSNPKFTNIGGRDFSLQETSPGIDAGHSEGTPFDVDIMGTDRPQGLHFDMGAFELNSSFHPGNNPPLITEVSITNAVTVVVNFSDAYDPSDAQNPSNYTISNGITVTAAVLSADGKKVTLTTSAHTIGQSYVVSVNNVKDITGNPISSTANSAGYSFINDSIPPQLTGTSLSQRTELQLTFSEEMNPQTIGNIKNYSINNNISITAVTLSPGNKNVILTTTLHSPDVGYILTVNNVKDIAGNLIDPANKTADYRINNNNKYHIMGTSAQWYQNFSPLKSTDGISDTTSTSRWGGVLTLPDSITFTLDQLHNISETHISFFRWNYGRIYNYSIFVSPNGTSWTKVVNNHSSVESKWTVDNFTAIQGRFIKLVFLSCNEDQSAGLWEAEILGPDKADVSTIEQGLENPKEFSLEQNYPNPFNPTTKIDFNIPSDQNVKIDIYNEIGELINTLVNKFYPAGKYTVNFDASRLPSGMYIYRIEAGSFVSTKKMMLVK